MELQMRVEPDGSLTFVTAQQQVVASLSRLHVSLLQSLLDMPMDGPFIGVLEPTTRRHPTQRPQLVVIPGSWSPVSKVARDTTRLGLTATVSDGTARLTSDGHRLAQWLRQQWSGWMHYHQQFLRFQPTA